MSDVEQWWRGLPVITRWLFTTSFVLTVIAHFGVISPYYLILEFTEVFKSFQIWRLVTCFIYQGRLGLPFLIHMLFLVRYGSVLEQNDFAGRTADFFFMLIFGGSLLLVTAYFLDLVILGMPLIMMMIYYWSKVSPNVPMSFMFGFKFESKWFPWVLVAFTTLTGGSPMYELLGIAVGHLYFFLNDMYPRLNNGRVLLKTPQFLKNLFPAELPRAPGGQPDQPHQRFAWGGQGHRLGGN